MSKTFLRVGIIGLVVAVLIVLAILGWMLTGSPMTAIVIWILGIVLMMVFHDDATLARRQRRHEARICQRCGYDLHAHDAAASCPECGLPGDAQKP